MKAIDRKETILNGCFKLFLQRKQGTVTVADLEKVLGVTRGKIYYYYKDIDEITRSTAEHYFKKVEDYFSFFYLQEEKITLLEFIFRYVENWKQFDQSIMEVTGESATSVIKFFLHASIVHPDFEDKIKLLFEKEQKSWATVLGKAIEAKEIRDDVDVPVTATKFYCINMGVLTQSLFIPHSFKANTLQMLLISLYEDLKKPSGEVRNIFK